ncbi:ATP-binding cassette domain-containing protein [Verrucomicrobiaceae bacterium R5-34]|uniref:ATP-binding cassette domain-containing protein n=1 Tax=Oceaniferula flava TaxID=2800421 RepID=A0AAE2SEL3_9BACT|nr:ATP-binding cassette domain-containing protein [Oceaniferula flavus]MBK1830023.1 ATP-binding cassette domain-containing protein [Verrucomicrobiaceae bacterium R5-34]MBK1855130.1 ATP-binding cassette domain-containing protein [Oceaniferula flavus]MBM1136436.1 ATP-binding cassette domain-containing protein [Oceaniferula flavus]
MIDVRNLSKRYGRHTAVNDLTFEVGAGKIVGFLGPNGAGKTTTLRMLTGYLPPSSGSANIAGYDIFRQSLKARRNIGYMPENVPLYDDMRVREYLKYRAQIKGLKGKQARTNIAEAMDLCGLTHVRRKMIKTLSKGYRQRVGLADALVHKPDLLILDEPTNGLDPNQIRSIRNLIKRLGETHTILVSTHILHEVEMTCDHVIIIDEGKIKATGSPAELVHNMRTAGKITVELLADAETAAGAIGRLEHVKKVITETTSDEWSKFSVLVDSGTDTRERIANIASQYGWPMRTLHRQKSTLEEVFVELTRKD